MVRPAAVTTVRIDIGFVELLDESDAVLAREDTERLRAWQDDEVPEVGLSLEVRPFQAGWRTPQASHRPEGSAYLSVARAEVNRCLEAAVERGAPSDSHTVLSVQVQDGRVRSARATFSSLADRAALRCLRRVASRGQARGTGRLEVVVRYRAP